jgi:4-hydroxy-4-methyl-2-oxoglutarate aldolase
MKISEAHLKRLATVDQGMISDSMARLGISGWMDGVRAVNGFKAGFAGPARTVLYGPKRGSDGVGRTTYAIVESMTPGEILVFGSGGTEENLLGDNVAAYAEHHRLAAIVTDSKVRDGSGMNRLSIPIYARGITARLPVLVEPAAFDVPIVCGGAQVRPGDIVVGGYDGLLVLPPSRIEEALRELDDVERIEGELQRLIASGAPSSAIDPVLKRKKTGKAPSGS